MSSQKSNKPIKPDKTRILYKDRQHLPWPDPEQQGLNGQKLSEEGIIPQFFERPGDCIISPKTLKRGTDNNTMIIMGRDRNGVAEGIEQGKMTTESGFGHHMGAGAIDIVVGRMAPFPLGSLYGDPSRPLKVGPAFKTKRYEPESALRNAQIGNFQDGYSEGMSLESEKVLTADHPGIVMDAARIYISQMTQLDDYFGIKKDIFVTPGLDDQKSPSTPHSGIMIKADEVRLHSRKDIKIVTGGINETHDSQGNPILNPGKGRIHLIVGNGLNPQHPVPLGNNLVALFADLFKILEEYVNNVNTFISQQIIFNAATTGHVHTELGATGMPTLPSLMTLKVGSETTYKQLAKNVIGGGLAVGVEIGKLKKYINPGSPDNTYINSRSVTTS